MAEPQGTLVEPAAVVQDLRVAASTYRARSLVRITLRRLARSYSALWGLFMVCALIFIAVFADAIAPYGSAEIVSGGGSLTQPSWQHPMGIDLLGRDVFSRVIYSSRVAIYVGIVSIILSLLPGIPLGIVAGFYGGRIDKAIMTVMDIILAFPIFLLAIVVMVILEPSTTNVVIALGIVRIPIYARVVRGSVLSVKENEYIEAVRALALGPLRMLFRHILPNCMAPIIVTSTLSVATSILIESSLSFLGLGTQPPTPSWGWDLKANLVFIDMNPWIVISPGLAIFLTTLAFNMLGDGLRDALDPRLKR
ncbi:MAG: ABC transporter permease [Nitrospinae bacterium]|nr:ABC transporter permease [Nitrospinota bacterium]